MPLTPPPRLPALMARSPRPLAMTLPAVRPPAGALSTLLLLVLGGVLPPPMIAGMGPNVLSSLAAGWATELSAPPAALPTAAAAAPAVTVTAAAAEAAVTETRDRASARGCGAPEPSICGHQGTRPQRMAGKTRRMGGWVGGAPRATRQTGARRNAGQVRHSGLPGLKARHGS